jgi:hypothetical protein
MMSPTSLEIPDDPACPFSPRVISSHHRVKIWNLPGEFTAGSSSTLEAWNLKKEAGGYSGTVPGYPWYLPCRCPERDRETEAQQQQWYDDAEGGLPASLVGWSRRRVWAVAYPPGPYPVVYCTRESSSTRAHGGRGASTTVPYAYGDSRSDPVRPFRIRRLPRDGSTTTERHCSRMLSRRHGAKPWSRPASMMREIVCRAVFLKSYVQHGQRCRGEAKQAGCGLPGLKPYPPLWQCTHAVAGTISYNKRHAVQS